jgi:outer membrane protein TolC
MRIYVYLSHNNTYITNTQYKEIFMKRKTSLWVVLFVFFISLPAAWSLTLDEVLGGVGNTYEVRSAQAAIESMRQQIEELSYVGDMTVSFQPSVDANTPVEGPFANTVDLAGSMSLTAPIGLTDSKALALVSAQHALDLAIKNLERVEEATYFKLYSLYQDAWLAQEELVVLQLELDAAQATYEVKRFLFESGNIALLELALAEDELDTRQTDLLKGQLEHRLTSFELTWTRGLQKVRDETADFDEDVELLEAYVESPGELPRPGQLEGWVEENHPDVLQQLEKIRQVESSIAELKGIDLTATLRANVSAFSHNGSVSYNVNASTITGSYSFPIHTFTFAEDKASSQPPWSVGLSVNLGYTTAKGAELEAASLAHDLAAEQARLGSIREILDFQLRSKYQQYLIAVEAADQSVRNFERSSRDLLVIDDRWQMGLITENELLEATARNERALLASKAAKIAVIKTEMAAAESAAYLSQYLSKGN